MKNLLRTVLGVPSLAMMLVSHTDAAAAAEKACTVKMTVNACVDFWQGKSTAVQPVSDTEAESARQRGRANAIGPNDSGDSDTSSKAKDLRQLFSVLFETAKLDDKTGNLVLTSTPKFLEFGGAQGQLQATIRAPKLYGEIEKKIPEASRAARKAVLEKMVNDLDDISLELTFSPQGKHLGRSFADHETEYRDLRAKNDSFLKAPEDQFLSLIAAIGDKYVDHFEKDLKELGFEDLTFEQVVTGKKQPDCDDSCTRNATVLMAELKKTVQDLLDARAKVDAADRDGLIWDFGALLNNQPQLTFSYLRDLRDDLVGPDRQIFTVTQEWGYPRLSGVVGKLDSKSEDIQKYRKALKRAHKFTVSFQYAKASDLKFTIPGSEGFPDPLSIDIDEATAKTFDFSYSCSLFTDDKGKQISGLSFTLEYDDVSDNPKLRDRWLGKLTYTTKISDTLDLPLTLVYSNHSRFLADEDHQIDAHFAIRYKLAKAE